MKKLKTLFGFSLFVLFCWQCSAVIAAPQVGWWWNPAESGRGFFIESQNGVTFLGAYFYDTDGHATWLVAGGANADPYNYTGPLYATSGGQTLFGTYVAPQGSAVGTVSVHFSDDTHGTLTWPGGTVAIERQIFGGTGAAFQPFSGWWWNADESGSGYSVELQGDKLFIVGFMYDDGGRPVWYFSAGPMTDDTTYSGTVLQFANGQTMGGPYQPPGPPATVATLDVQFAALDEATLTFTEASVPAANGRPVKAGRKKSKTVKPQFPKDGTDVPPKGFTGHFSIDTKVHIAGDGETDDLHFVHQFALTWLQYPDAPTVYDAQGTLTLTYDAVSTTSDGLFCTSSGSDVRAVNSISIAAMYLALGASPFQRYTLDLLIVPGKIALDTTVTCTDPDGFIRTSSAQAAPGTDFLNYAGPIVGDTIKGGGVKTIIDSAGTATITSTITYDWFFGAIR